MLKLNTVKKFQIYEVKKPSFWKRIFRRREIKKVYRMPSGQIAMF